MSCTPHMKIYKGVYQGTLKDFGTYVLELKSDSTFIFYNYSHCSTREEGRWFLCNDFINLTTIEKPMGWGESYNYCLRRFKSENIKCNYSNIYYKLSNEKGNLNVVLLKRTDKPYIGRLQK